MINEVIEGRNTDYEPIHCVSYHTDYFSLAASLLICPYYDLFHIPVGGFARGPADLPDLYYLLQVLDGQV